MEKLENKYARRYLRRVRALLPCSRREKKPITLSLSESLADFLEEQPEADYAAIQERFGNPETVAAMCIAETPMPRVLKEIRIRSRVWRLAVAVALLILLSWAGYVLYTQHSIESEVYNGHYVDTIHIISRTDD